MQFFDPGKMNWYQLQSISNRSYRCGFCSDQISTAKGYRLGDGRDGSSVQRGGLYVCPNCQGPTFFPPDGDQKPAPPLGRPVLRVPSDLEALYEEARACATSGCYTASVLLCRKMLMNLAVSQGATEGLSFIKYVEYLSNEGYIPPNGKHWVDHIRKKGNEATHEIALMNVSDATELISMTEMMLKFIYEFPSMIPSPSKT